MNRNVGYSKIVNVKIQMFRVDTHGTINQSLFLKFLAEDLWGFRKKLTYVKFPSKLLDCWNESSINLVLVLTGSHIGYCIDRFLIEVGIRSLENIILSLVRDYGNRSVYSNTRVFMDSPYELNLCMLAVEKYA